MAVILCIDDSENGLLVRKLLLETQGHQVLAALTAEHALEQFLTNQVKLVVSDYLLKETTGIELAKAMRSLKPEVPFILLSGQLDPPDDMRDVDVFVTKGGGPHHLLEVITDLLGG